MASGILTLNAGSSSLKYALYVDGERITAGSVDHIGTETASHAAALQKALDAIGAPPPIDDAVLAELPRLAPLAPDPLPAEIALIEAMRARSAKVPQVACFDT